MIDGGHGRNAWENVKPGLLAALNSGPLSAVVCTHSDSDHITGGFERNFIML